MGTGRALKGYLGPQRALEGLPKDTQRAVGYSCT